MIMQYIVNEVQFYLNAVELTKWWLTEYHLKNYSWLHSQLVLVIDWYAASIIFCVQHLYLLHFRFCIVKTFLFL